MNAGIVHSATHCQWVDSNCQKIAQGANTLILYGLYSCPTNTAWCTQSTPLTFYGVEG